MILNKKLLVSIIFWFLVVFISVFFLLGQLKYSRYKSLWVDENYGLITVVKHSITSMIINGIPEQGSPSPLDYIFIKLIHNMRKSVGYLGLQPTTYYRLPANISTMVAGIVVVAISWFQLNRKKKILVDQIILILLSLLFFLFNYSSYYYSAEMRPYALWNGLWFIALSSFFVWPRLRFVSLVSLTLLAFSATASIFQILSLVVAFLIVSFFRNRNWKKTILNSTIFLIPLFISAYYSLKTTQWYVNGAEWDDFLRFWLRHFYIAAGSIIAIGVSYYFGAPRNSLIPPVATLILYLMCPLILTVTQARGFIFTPRHYIHFVLAVPIFLLSLSYSVPHNQKSRLKRGLAICRIAVGVMAIAFYSLRVHGTIDNALYAYTRHEYWGVPLDKNEVLTSLLKKELPIAFCTSKINDSLRANIERTAEWMAFQFSYLPLGNKVVLLKPTNSILSEKGDTSDNAEVISVIEFPCAKNHEIISIDQYLLKKE